MTRIVTVGGAQLGPVQLADGRASVVSRLIELLTTFFPRWFLDDIAQADHFYERSMPNDATQPLFDEAKRLGIGFCLGYALLEEKPDGTHHRWNVQSLVDKAGSIVATFKKVHIPGHELNEPGRPFQHLERYYFEPSPEGFGVWDAFDARVGMMICNDRRWPESYLLMGLQGVELILCGYNTPLHYAPDPSQDPLQGFHNQLVMSSGAYQNGSFVVGVAKGGVEEGVDSLAESSIFGPSGELLARAETNGDELIVAECDLDWCAQYKETLFDFARYRRPELYGAITDKHVAD
ncbi:MAG: N-carbamoyl-D-amino-acid hydrolase [Actinobacteria bacterium]|nr:N-carbamoyl-D-amino-acid hydrolase [Actinomycetota bacterium]